MASSSDNDNDGGWTVVTKSDKRRIARMKANPAVSPNPHSSSESSLGETKTVPTDQVKCSLQECQKELQSTSFYKDFMEHISPFEEIVCYGVGNFVTSRRSPPAAMYQLALCTLQRTNRTKVQTYFFDPCSTDQERDILKDLQVSIIPNNERGFRKVSRPTLFYMPHCPLRLYNNVLLANWDNLHLVQIFGNSLSAYDIGSISRKLPKGIECLLNFLEEVPCRVSKGDVAAGDLDKAFNDCYFVRVSLGNSELPVRPKREDSEDGEVI